MDGTLTLFIQVLDSIVLEQVKRIQIWSGKLVSLCRKSAHAFPWKLLLVHQVLVAMSAKAIITEHECLNIRFYHICLPIIPSKCWFGEEGKVRFSSVLTLC